MVHLQPVLVGLSGTERGRDQRGQRSVDAGADLDYQCFKFHLQPRQVKRELRYSIILTNEFDGWEPCHLEARGAGTGMLPPSALPANGPESCLIDQLFPTKIAHLSSSPLYIFARDVPP